LILHPGKDKLDRYFKPIMQEIRTFISPWAYSAIHNEMEESLTYTKVTLIDIDAPECKLNNYTDHLIDAKVKATDCRNDHWNQGNYSVV
jgi:hypothetical protein